MKLRSLLVGFCISLCSTVFAANQHLHPQATHSDKNPAGKTVAWPGACEIEIINNSYDDVRVYGVFDDGISLVPFTVYSYEAPRYISLYYYGYCHAGMNLYIDTWAGYHVYSGYTPRQTSIRVVPYLANQVKAEVRAK